MSQLQHEHASPESESGLSEEHAEGATSPHQPAREFDLDMFRSLLSRFHQAMVGVCALGVLIVYAQWGADQVIPCLLGSALVWINMVVLAYGLRGVFTQQKSLIFVLLLKFGLLVGGVYVLSQLFPDQQVGLVIGCSTWVLASILVGQGGPISSGTKAAVLALLLLCPPPAFAEVTEAEMLEGEVEVKLVKVAGSPMPKIVARGIIKSKVADLWSVIADCENYKKTMDNVLHSKFHGLVKGKKRCELVFDLPWPISNLRSLVDVTLTERKDGVKIRTWKLVEGDYHKNTGEWRLIPRKDGYTEARYMVHVEPKISIPDWIQRKAQKSKIPDLFEDLSELMEKRGKLLP